MIEHRGRVIIATTNHIDRIDPALLRPGRFDYKIKLEHFTINEIKEFINKKFPQRKKETNRMDFSKVDISPAVISHLWLENPNNYGNFIKEVMKCQ
jgi:chaperone BCS1